MFNALKNAVTKFESQVKNMNSLRHAGSFRPLKVTVLGQQGLLIRHESLKSLNLLATTDFDGLLKGEPPLEDIFKNYLREEGLSYDEQSQYIWLPEETEYETIYESEYISINSPLPIYLIVSKAVKAPKKNKQLVLQAITEFGDKLQVLLEEYNVDIEYFLGESYE